MGCSSYGFARTASNSSNGAKSSRSIAAASAAYDALKIGGRFSPLLIRDPETHCISLKGAEPEGGELCGRIVVHPSGCHRE